MHQLHLILLYLVTVLVVSCLASGSTSGNGPQFPYPIEASWFSDKYSYKDWFTAIENFQSIGGHIIWKRGRIFRPISADDLQSHPDYQVATL